MSKSQAGRLGGLSTLKKYGKNHMSKIGKQGARATWTKYAMKPVGLTEYAMVNKQTGIIVAIIAR